MYCYQENINLIPTVGCNNNSNGNNTYCNKNLNDKIIVHEEQFIIELWYRINQSWSERIKQSIK